MHVVVVVVVVDVVVNFNFVFRFCPFLASWHRTSSFNSHFLFEINTLPARSPTTNKGIEASVLAMLRLRTLDYRSS